MRMILLLGATGYVGSTFERLLHARGLEYRCISRECVDYTKRESLIELLKESRPSFVINAAGYTGKPNVDACETHKADCLLGNAVLPGIIREACDRLEIPWGHISSGCIFTGTRADGAGFTEEDAPNFCFRTDNCSFYSGCKAVGEECLDGAENVFIWRLRIPFNEVDSPRNYISKLMRYEWLLDATNSISQLDEIVNACLECWLRRVPYGIYNVTNTGSITTREVVDLIREHLGEEREFKFFDSEDQFLQLAAKTPRSNCILDNTKLLSTGIQLSPVREAVERALKNWKPEASVVS